MQWTEEDVRNAFKAGVTKGEHRSYFDAPLDEEEYLTELKKDKNNTVLADVSNSSFNDEKFIEALFAEYNKSYAETKQGQHYPQWLNDEQLKWVLTVAKNCC